jgi:hypothetical protein
MSYGATVIDAVHQAGIYAGKILSGDKAADLPVIEVRDQTQGRPALGCCAAYVTHRDDWDVRSYVSSWG